jgi:hypothetical protein
VPTLGIPLCPPYHFHGMFPASRVERLAAFAVVGPSIFHTRIFLKLAFSLCVRAGRARALAPFRDDKRTAGPNAVEGAVLAVTRIRWTCGFANFDCSKFARFPNIHRTK